MIIPPLSIPGAAVVTFTPHVDGLKFSGGEKQRTPIVWALMRDPEILVLDEATSNLDSESEAIVLESINPAAETAATFIVAHRLSTVRRADVIYVMIFRKPAG